MDKLLREIPLFLEVARQKSFTRAADNLDKPLATISRRIAELEKKLGMPLFFRNTRKVELTESGRLFFEHCCMITEEAKAAVDNLTNRLERPRGLISLVLPPEVYAGFLQGKLGDFASRWPEIQLHIHTSNHLVNFHHDEYDLYICSGNVQDSEGKIRKLFTLRPSLYASPKLFAQCRMPENPADVASLPCISRFQDGNEWVFHKETHAERIFVRPKYMVDNNSVALDLVLAGAGLTWLIPAQIASHEESGELIRVLSEWRHTRVDLSIVMANTLLPQRIRIFVDYLVEYFSRLPQ